MNITWTSAEELFPAARKLLKPADAVLDIGAGIMPQAYLRPIVHICCEPFPEYVQHLQSKVAAAGDRNYVVVQASWAEAVRIFPPNSVDTVFLLDVIEHVDKEEAIRLLKCTESLARGQIAVFTPLGFLPQTHPDGRDAWGLHGGALQEHRSGWMPEDFGESWEFVAAKEYHLTDNKGRAFERPYGAFWAIKNCKGENGVVRVGVRTPRQRMHIALDWAMDVVKGALQRAYRCMRSWLQRAG